MSSIPAWLAVILAPGAAGFVWALFKGIDLWRNGTATQEARAIKNISDYAERESYRADRNQDLLDYYRSYAGTLEWIIRVQLGPDYLPVKPPLPQPPPRPQLSKGQEEATPKK